MASNNKFKYMIFCQQCKYKRYTNGEDLDDLVQIKNSNFQLGSVKYDPKTRTQYNPPLLKRTKLFRCPKCGFAMKAYDPNKRMENEK